jgi:oligopeptide transport system permease protein
MSRRTIAAAVVVAIAIACYLGPIIAGWLGVDGTTIDTAYGARGPSWSHWFGTDPLGRDMLVRVMVGGRIALAVGAVATVIAVAIGVAWGATAAYAGGIVDGVMMRIVDTLYGFPILVFAIVVMGVFQTHSITALIGVIASVSWLTLARITRGQVLVVRHRDFIEAARALGAPPRRIVLRHVLPNAAGPIIVYATLALPQIMLVEAFLSFLGVQAPLASWGTLVTEGSTQLVVYPWLLVCPGLVMGAIVVALNFLGDGLTRR